MLIFNTMTIFQIIGIQFQKSFFLGSDFFEGGNPQIFVFVIICITFFFNFVSMVMCFFVYKTFKVMFLKGGVQDDVSVPMTETNNKDDFTPFKGEGVKIG